MLSRCGVIGKYRNTFDHFFLLNYTFDLAKNIHYRYRVTSFIENIPPEEKLLNFLTTFFITCNFGTIMILLSKLRYQIQNNFLSEFLARCFIVQKDKNRIFLFISYTLSNKLNSKQLAF